MCQPIFLVPTKSKRTGMLIRYHEHGFEFRNERPGLFRGLLLLNAEEQKLLRELREGESDDWYLDDDGYRLDAEQLFARSPWAWDSPSGTVKLLCRYLNLNTGEAWFSTPDT